MNPFDAPEAVLALPAAPEKELAANEIARLVIEVEQAIHEAAAHEKLLVDWNPELARRAVRLLTGYGEQINRRQEKFDFDSVRITEEEWELQFLKRLYRNSPSHRVWSSDSEEVREVVLSSLRQLHRNDHG